MSSKKTETKVEEKKKIANSRNSKKSSSSSSSTKKGVKSNKSKSSSSTKSIRVVAKSSTKVGVKTTARTGSKTSKAKQNNKISEIERTKELEELEALLNEKVISSTELKNMLKKEVKFDDKEKSKNEIASKKNSKENEKKKEKYSSKIIVFLLLFFLISGACAGGYSYYTYSKEQKSIELARLEVEEKIRREEEERRLLLEEEERKKQLIAVAETSVKALYNKDNIPKMGVTDEEIIEVLKIIDKVEDENVKKSLNESIDNIQVFREVEKDIQSLLVKNVLISDYSEEAISRLNTKYNKLSSEWKKSFKPSINKIKTQKNNIKSAKSKVSALFSDKKMKKVKSNVTRSKYNAAKKAINALPQKDIIKEYKPYLDKVLKAVEKKEEKAKKEAEEKAQREAEIENAWVVLDTPYISQNKQKIYNGCEAASLLMGLQYKGYLKGTSLKTFVDNMPKSDNPHTGFVRDIYGTEPKDVPHWIAPDALASYGRSASASNSVIEITGASVASLKKELDNGNPIVFYATGGNFDDPKNWVEEVPNNVHVMLLVGYNPISKQMVINDPWTKTASGKVYISESRFTTIYNKLGKRAVVIRKLSKPYKNK